MGLDNIWIEPKNTEVALPTFSPPLKLAVGFMTDPARSFRGKCYADLVELVTDADLYEDHDNDSVRRIACTLESFVALVEHDVEARKMTMMELRRCCPGSGIETVIEHVNLSEIKDLARMFRAFGDAGFSLAAWY